MDAAGAFVFASGGFAEVEAQSALPGSLIGAVTGEAVVGENGADIAIEGDLGGWDATRDGGRQQGEAQADDGAGLVCRMHQAISGFAETGNRITIHSLGNLE
jgi:hypothetical protein